MFVFLSASAKFKIGGRIVSGISAQDEQHVHFAGAHVGDQIFDRFDLVDRVRVDGIGVEYGLADVAQRLVHGVSQEHAPLVADDRRRSRR